MKELCVNLNPMHLIQPQPVKERYSDCCPKAKTANR